MIESTSRYRCKCLLVSCHPLANSLCNYLVDQVKLGFARHSIEVDHLDLYKSNFTAPLTPAERQNYHTNEFESSALTQEIEALKGADILILVFPTWWFGLPALLKGWFDRVWAPGVAFDHPSAPGGRITPKLSNLKHCLVITTLGSPWWFDHLVLWRPLRRILKRALIGTCSPAAEFKMFSLYNALTVEHRRLERFLLRVNRAVDRVIQNLPASQRNG